METNACSEIRIIPLGGLDKIGMNITVFEYNETIVVIDCGSSFPEEEMYGIDKVIPDVTYLMENREKVKGYVITHGHEDHIGALSYIIKLVNAPIYATRLTMGLIEHKLEEEDLLATTERTIVTRGNSVDVGEVRVEFIRTNHSIAGSAALALYTPAGTFVHTGDFKIDHTPLFGEPIDLQRIAAIGREGVLAVMCDSTNAIRPGFTQSEVKVAKTIEGLFSDYEDKRMIITTFASNVDRVQQIIHTASRFDRKVLLQGRSMETVIEIAEKMNYVKIPENTLITVEELANYPDEKVVLLTTGSQGEAMAALTRMAEGIHRKASIKPNDVVIFSSSPIPGNEKAVSKVINLLKRRGASVIFQDTHVSGHACEEEIKLLYSLLRPKYAIPAHGEFRHLQAGAELAKSVCVADENAFILEVGDILTLSKEKAEITGKIPVKPIYVDGLGVGDVGNIVIRDRQNLAENGIIIVTMCLEKGTDTLLSGPDIISRGFVYVRESAELIDELKNITMDALDECERKGYSDWGKIKGTVKDYMGDFLWKKMKRKPMILPIIMEV